MKKTPLSAFSRPRASGIIAVDLRDDDQLVGVRLTDGQREIMLFTSGGKCHPLQRGGGAPDGSRLHRCARREAGRRPDA